MENGSPNAIASNPSSFLPRAELFRLREKLRPVEPEVKRERKKGEVLVKKNAKTKLTIRESVTYIHSASTAFPPQIRR